jgi:GYF domain 2
MANNWFIGRNKEKIGPFTSHQIQQLASLGMVKAEDHLLEEGAAKWVAATSLPWLAFAQGAEQYVLTLFGKRYGPYTAQQVRVALLSGNISPDTPACPQNGKDWLPLRQMTEFCRSLPTTVKESDAPSRVGGPTMSREEAELYIAGKHGDSLAKLVFTLQEIRKRFADNPGMQDLIGKNIRDLLEAREKGNLVPRDASPSSPIPGA